MRLSAELLGSSEQRQNAVGERELVLRGLAIPAIEHLAVTQDAFDAIDFTDNRLQRLDNLPRLSRLSSLNLAGNVIESVDEENLNKNVPNLTTINLCHNNISALHQVANLGKACQKIEFLSLQGNPVTRKLLQQKYCGPVESPLLPNSLRPEVMENITDSGLSSYPLQLRAPYVWRCAYMHTILQSSDLDQRPSSDTLLPLLMFVGRQHYRLYAIHQMPSLKTLDYIKISKTEREKAKRLAGSAAGAALESDVQGEAREASKNGVKTFVPGEGESAEESFITNFTQEQKDQIREMVANAGSATQIEEIERTVKRGQFPEAFLNLIHKGSEGKKRSSEGEPESSGKKQKVET